MKLIGAMTMVASAATGTPTTEIFPGVHMPLVGLGTWQYNDTVVYEAVCAAFDAGYTYVDTAWGYNNEIGVGKALKDCWFGKGKLRKDLFLMGKIPGGLNASEVAAAHADNLQWLGLDYVDHLMTHFPCDWDKTPERCNPLRRQEGWQAMEQLFFDGKAKSLGVSHYCKQHIDDVLAVAQVRPVINQVEWHVGSGDVDEVIAYGQSKGIFFQSYSPLCGPCQYKDKERDSLINGKMVTDIAAKYPGVNPSQVSLKYLVQTAQNNPFYAGVIPKSDKLTHLKENKDLFHFTLSKQDMKTLAGATEPAGTPGDCDAN